MPDTTTTLDLKHVGQAPAWDRVASSYAELIRGHLGLYAAHALELAAVTAGDRVLDVATGPGTLALQAADVTKVHALDFSAGMLEALRAGATPAQRANLTLRQGDGQALPYADASFDAAFSMFGLFMFPDRAAGFAELARVLAPGGRAVVASWQPQEKIVVFSAVVAELIAASGAPRAGGQPLADPDVFEAEMSAAGFLEVEVHPVERTWRSPSLEVFWDGLQRSHVGLGVARVQLPTEEYEGLLARIYARLERELGTGAQEVVMPAWLAMGRRG